MKKINKTLGLIAICFLLNPMITKAATEFRQIDQQTNTIYGTVTVEESYDTEAGSSWLEKTAGSGDYYISQQYKITKTFGDYFYVQLNETNNVKITSVLVENGFTKISESDVTNGKLILVKAKNTISSSTLVLTVSADIVDSSIKKCELSYSLLSPSCINIGDVYTNKDGKAITKDEYNEICDGITSSQQSNSLSSDVPGSSQTENPPTGSVIPYVAIGGGLIAIACVFFFSRRHNKIYKL